MRLALVNPNTSTETTDAFAAIARRAAASGTEIVPVTGQFGARLMLSAAEYDVGAHAALAALAEHADRCDGAIMAAFGDFGVAAARDLFRFPVISLAEAACTAAALAGQPYALITIAHSAVSRMRQLTEAYHVAHRLAGIHVIEPVADPAVYAAGVIDLCRTIATEGKAALAVLAGPPLSEIYEKLAGKTAIPLIEGVSAAVRLVEAIVGLGIAPASRPERAAPIMPDVSGVSPALTKAIDRRSRRSGP